MKPPGSGQLAVEVFGEIHQSARWSFQDGHDLLGATMPTLTGLPEHGLILSGDPPTLHNNATRRVLLYTFRLEVIRNGIPFACTVQRDAFLGMRNDAFYRSQIYAHPTETLGIPPGDSQPVTFTDFERGEGIIQSIALDAVVFEDGEFVGPDVGGTFDKVNLMVGGERDLHRQVLKTHTAGGDPWTEVRAIAATDKRGAGPMPQGLYLRRHVRAAQELLNVLNTKGEAVALALAESSSVYPKIWRGARQ